MLLLQTIIKLHLSLYLFFIPVLKKDISFLEKLEENDKLIIRFESQGCFHSYNETLIISKKNGNYIANYKNKEVLMNLQILLAYQLFENKLKTFKSESTYYCTTVDKYFVSCPGFTGDYLDDSCDWNGFRNLKDEIFGK